MPCPFALGTHGKLPNSVTIGRQGVAALQELSGTIATAQRVVLLLAASDVTLLRVKIPPLSSARLKAALPNLVEDQLLGDPADCVVVAGGTSDGLRTVAVVQRAWLDKLAKTMNTFGARRLTALPASVCLPFPSDQPGCVTAAINEWNTHVDITLRLTEQNGVGLAISHEQNESAAHATIRALGVIVPEAPIALYVPHSLVQTYQDEANQACPEHSRRVGELNGRVSVFADNWSRWIAGAHSVTLDLMAGMGTGTGPALDWRPWRWPLALGCAILVINAAALNIEWWRMKSEAATLRATMVQVYKSAYPNETVIIDPVAQMQQKIAAAKHNSGMAAPDDFTALTAAFGEAWSKIMPSANLTAPNPIVALEYREHSLFVRLRQTGDSLKQQLSAELAKRGLSLTQAATQTALESGPEKSGTATWQIRSAK